MSIRISEKHGVNPSLQVCFWCGEAMGVVLYGRLANDAEAPRKTMTSYEACQKCQDGMALGITLIEVREQPNFDDQPAMQEGRYPTGRWTVMTTEAILRLISPFELARSIMQKRKAFIPPEVWEALGITEAMKRSE